MIIIDHTAHNTDRRLRYIQTIRTIVCIKTNMDLITKYHKNHKNIFLPLTVLKKNNFDNNLNNNDRFKIILINNGNFLININSKNYFLKNPALIFLNEEDVISFNNNEITDYQIIYFHPAVINAKFNFNSIKMPDKSFTPTDILDMYILIPFIEKNQIKFFHLNQLMHKKTEKLFNNISNMLINQNDDYWPCKSRSYLIELLYLMRSIYSEKDNYKNTELDDINEATGKVILYLHSNYEKKITINDLTKIFFTNRTTLSEKFKKKTGQSIIEYLNKLRIDIACQMLRDTNCIIEDISERTGFPDISNFGRTFKKMTGLTPTRYKNQFDTMKYYNSDQK